MKYAFILILSLTWSSFFYAQRNTGNYERLWTYSCQYDIFAGPFYCWDTDELPYPSFHEIPGKDEVISFFGEYIRIIDREGVKFEKTGINGKTLFVNYLQDDLFVCWHSRRWGYDIPLRFERYDYEGNLLFEDRDTLFDTREIKGHQFLNQNSIIIADGTKLIFYNNQCVRINSNTSPIDFSSASFEFQISNESAWLLNDFGEAIKLDIAIGNITETKSINSNEKILAIEKMEGSNSLFVLFTDKIEQYDENLNLLKSISITTYEFAQKKPWHFIDESEILIYGEDNQSHIIQLVDLSVDSVVLQKSFQPEINPSITNASWIDYNDGHFYIFGSSKPERFKAYWEFLKIELETMELKRTWGELLEDSRPTSFLTVPVCHNFYLKDSIQILTFGLDMNAFGSDGGWNEERAIILEDIPARYTINFQGRVFDDANFNCLYDEGEPLLSNTQVVDKYPWSSGTFVTDTTGQFFFTEQRKNQSKEYEFEVTLSDEYSFCPVDLETAWLQESDTIFVDFPVINLTKCKGLKVEVDLEQPTTYCNSNQIEILIENQSDTVFSEVKLDLLFDSLFIVDSISHPVASIVGTQMVFELGEIDSFSNERIILFGRFICEILEDEIFNVQAEISPKSSCQDELSFLTIDNFESEVTEFCPIMNLNVRENEPTICQENTFKISAYIAGYNHPATGVFVVIELDSFMLNPNVEDFDFQLDGDELTVYLDTLERSPSKVIEITYQLGCDVPEGITHKIKASVFANEKCLTPTATIVEDSVENIFPTFPVGEILNFQNDSFQNSFIKNKKGTLHFVLENVIQDSIFSRKIILDQFEPQIPLSLFSIPNQNGMVAIDTSAGKLEITKPELDFVQFELDTIQLEINLSKEYSILDENFSFSQQEIVEGQKVGERLLATNTRQIPIETENWNYLPNLKISQEDSITNEIDISNSFELEITFLNERDFLIENAIYEIQFSPNAENFEIENIDSEIPFSNFDTLNNSLFVNFEKMNFEIGSEFSTTIRFNLSNSFDTLLNDFKITSCAIVWDEFNYYENNCEELQLQISRVSSINKISSNKLFIQPNPSNNQINFTFSSPISKPFKFTLYNSTGQKVLFLEVRGDFSINKSEVGSGVFFFEMRKEGVIIERGKLIFIN